MVYLIPNFSFKGCTVWTDPFPKDVVPKIKALEWSCRAPATISDAEADPPLIRTTTGYLRSSSFAYALNTWVFSFFLPLTASAST